MKRNIFILFLLPLASVFSQKDPAAEAYLDKIAKDLDPGHALRIDFEYTREDLQSETEINGEGFLMLLDEKYKIDLGEAIILFDGEKQYSFQTEIEEVYISKPDPENKEFMLSDPIRLLRNYKEGFKYRMVGDAVFQNIDVKEIQLYPEELGGPYALLKLYVSNEKSELKAIVIRHKEGILYTMIVKEIKGIDDPEDDYFKFKSEDYPEYDIIDLMN